MVQEPTDVFLSYNRADQPAVERLARRLRAQHIQPWFDRWRLNPGDHWQDDMGEGLRTTKACAVIVGPNGLGNWAREELGVAQDRAVRDRTFRLFMVLLPGAPDPLDATLAFLRNRTWVDLRPGIEDPVGFQDLVAAITGIASSREDLVDSDVCPYQGLAAFEEEHAQLFFGRDHDIRRLLEQLRHTRFLSVLGPSGGGKSSLLRAGIVPALQAGGLSGSDTWAVRTFTPGAQPLANLAAQVVRLFPARSMARTLDELSQDRRTLDLALTLGFAEHPPDTRVLLIVDQFEELFALCSDEDQRASFLANLLHAATIPGGRLVLIIGMRADFYHRCADYADLALLMSAEQFLVSPLSIEGLREAIEEPAHCVGLELEAGLVETILGDVGGRPGTLPLLEHLLLEMWQHRRGRMLTLDAYVASGRVEGALAGRADAIYESFSTAQREVARSVLLRLVQPGEDNQDTRRRAPPSELVADPAQRDDLEVVVRALADRRLLTTGRDEVSGDRVVELTHEALIRGWPLLLGWINESRDALRAHRRLTETASEWVERGRDDGLLYRGSRLIDWQDRDTAALNETERAFLAVSREHEVREEAAGRRRRRRAVAGLTTALVVISAVAFVALQQGATARDRADLALSRELATKARTQLEIDPELAVILAQKAYTIKRTPQAASVLRQATLESRVRASHRDHEGSVHAAAFSPDGQFVVSAGDDGTVRLWDRSSTAQTAVLGTHEGRPVYAVAFSPDGRFVVSGGNDQMVRVWDRTGAVQPVVLRGHQGNVKGVAFSPDGRSIASAGNDQTVRVWDRMDARQPVILRGHEGSVNSVVFTPDGRSVVSASDDTTLRVWARTGAGEPVVLRGHTISVESVAFSSNGGVLISAGGDGKVRLWDRTGALAPVILGEHDDVVYGTAVSSNGRMVATSVADATVRVWDRLDVSRSTVLRGHQGAVNSVAFSADGQSIVSAGEDGTVRVWQPTAPGGRLILRPQAVVVNNGAFSRTGAMVISAGDDGIIRVWVRSSATDDLAMQNQLQGHEGNVKGVGLSSDEELLVSAGNDGTVRVWNRKSAEAPEVLRGHEGPVNVAAFSADGRLVVSAGNDGTVRVWDRTSAREPVVLSGHRSLVHDAEFSSDGELVVSAGADGTVRVWDLTRASEPVILQGHQGIVNSAAFSPDGRLVVSVGDDGTVRVWDRIAGGEPVVLRGHQGLVNSAAFSPDGQLVVSAGDDGTVRVWDRTGAEEPVVFRSDGGPVYEAAFSNDGRLLFGNDGTVPVWNCEVCGPMEDVLTLSRQRVTRELSVEERITFLNERP